MKSIRVVVAGSDSYTYVYMTIAISISCCRLCSRHILVQCVQVHSLVIVMRGGDKLSSEVGHNGSQNANTNKLNSGSSDSRCKSTIGTSCYIAVVWPVTTQHTPRTSWNVLLLE